MPYNTWKRLLDLDMCMNIKMTTIEVFTAFGAGHGFHSCYCVPVTSIVPNILLTRFPYCR